MRSDQPFIADIQELRRRARQHIQDGAVTGGYKGNLEKAVKVLNDALATELVCVLRYKRHYYAAEGIHGDIVKEEFLGHAAEEQQHADQIASRIVQLGGKPDLNPDSLLARSHSEYKEGTTLASMVTEDLIAERIAIDSYKAMIQYFGSQDPTSRRLMESILEKEEEHAEDMASLLKTLDPASKK